VWLTVITTVLFLIAHVESKYLHPTGATDTWFNGVLSLSVLVASAFPSLGPLTPIRWALGTAVFGGGVWFINNKYYR